MFGTRSSRIAVFPSSVRFALNLVEASVLLAASAWVVGHFDTTDTQFYASINENQATI